MPLPDERPRQSVANLIGKFETQSKHLSPSQSNPSRSSSVVSHVTGDSTKEEFKERREWPPKSEKTPPGSSRLIALTIDADGRKAFVKPEVEARLATNILQLIEKQKQETQTEPNTFLENWRKDLPQPTEIELIEPTPKPTDQPPAIPPPVQTVVSAPQVPRTPVMMKSSASKFPASSSSRSVGSSAKAQSKPTPRPSLTPATSAQPLRPQLTGQSVTSSASKRTISKAPAVPRTPPRMETGSKTPTLTPRSKTPSSGLFAPTAASLAKARNAPAPLPPPIKKTVRSSDAMDRLSRPTAASLSRVKTGPAQAAPTAKSPPRPSSIKSKSINSPSKSPQIKVKRDAAVPQTAGGSAAAAVAGVDVTPAVAEAVLEPAPVELITNGHSTIEETITEVDTTSEVEQIYPEEQTNDVVEPEVENEVVASSQTPETPDVDPEIIYVANSAAAEEVAPKSNLEDIVNLLETAPIARPSSEDISEIPDEDDK